MALRLAPVLPDHAELVLRWNADPVTRRFNPLEPATLEVLRERLARMGSDLGGQYGVCDVFRWIVEREGEPVGHVSLRDVNVRMCTAEIGYTVAPEHRGRGVGTAAVRLLVERAFAEAPLRRLVALVHAGNAASLSVLSKVGFVREGVLRQHYLIAGEPVDEVILGLLSAEWTAT